MRMETIRRFPLRFSIVLPTYACPFLYHDVINAHSFREDSNAFVHCQFASVFLLFQKFNGVSIPLQNDTVDNVATPNRSSKLQDSASITFVPKFEYNDDIDDELDPVLKEEIDRFVYYVHITAENLM